MRPTQVTALTIAGSDSGGGAGIQADLKTFAALRVFGTSVITALTAQNLKEVRNVAAVAPSMIRHQLEAVLDGFPIKAAKTGMLYSVGAISIVSDIMAQQIKIPLVVDPVLYATSGGRLMRKCAIRLLGDRLFPVATLVTPNVSECETLLGVSISSAAEQEKAAERFFRSFAVPVLLKGGHLPGEARDILYDGKTFTPFSSPRLKLGRTHGTGCILSAAITAFLAKGSPLADAVGKAKIFITGSLENATIMGNGIRLPNPFWKKRKES